ncbi:hypothetical protein BAUCODRAFT_77545 [Baudoinia panamericana UAMH 10762]|uniref:Uncharacterized protein n=1 Tax=Baudoinia panamericana (strain UAMH 10762) TaxID=717646 RepID=M2N216_BAUPA|nr:uncharacterized protein BAUCODRAFT_77545 [Baudoinia panamericana UAMH 10762]EMC92715.1 hypothetical protein BAUCODRAFT_77545 [Baudoinia panamericana UAMH 10762]
MPPAPSYTSTRNSYICLPDDPVGGMPRSRTFSNLPLPTRARRNAPMAPSKSQSRLPTALLPSTRLPSPPVSHRKYSHSRLAPTEVSMKPSLIRNRAKRSDTEPLLPLNVDLATNMGRATAFKENLTLSPVKPLPSMSMFDNKDLYGSSLPSRNYAGRHGWAPSSDSCEQLLPQRKWSLLKVSTIPLKLHAAKLSYSSPASRPSRERTAIPGRPQPAQRWNSQPILTNITNRRPSRHGQIPERRLMSEVQPVVLLPTPRTPLATEALTGSKVKSAVSSSRPANKVPSLTPFLPKPNSNPNHPTPNPSTQAIYTPKPIPYWCGRFAALTDRYHNDELATNLHLSKSDSDKMHSPEANTRRMRRAMEYLHSLCASQEARESFVVFQLQFAAVTGSAELARPMMVNLPPVRRVAVSGRQDVSGEAREVCEGVVEKSNGLGWGDGRKGTFVERLFGRHRRSLVL